MHFTTILNFLRPARLAVPLLSGALLLAAPGPAAGQSAAPAEIAQAAPVMEKVPASPSSEPAVASVPDTPQGGRLRISVQLARPFQGEVSLDMARTAALSAARVEAMTRAENGLAGLDALRLMLNSQEGLPELPVFGYALMRQESKFEENVSGLPPRLFLELRCAFVSVNPAQLNAQLTHLFKTPGLLENYALAAGLEKDSLTAYDRAVKHLLALPPVVQPLPEIAVTSEAQETAEAADSLQKTYQSLLGVRAYLDLLPDLYAESGLHAELLEPLEQALALLPDNFLLQSEAGRLYLWLELNSKAGEALDKAISLNPDFAQPYAHRGALWLLLQRPALALDDLSRAIALDPQNPEYYYGRAVVRQVAGDSAAMCADLEQSCLLGECDPYEWAKANSECP